MIFPSGKSYARHKAFATFWQKDRSSFIHVMVTSLNLALLHTVSMQKYCKVITVVVLELQ